MEASGSQLSSRLAALASWRGSLERLLNRETADGPNAAGGWEQEFGRPSAASEIGEFFRITEGVKQKQGQLRSANQRPGGSAICPTSISMGLGLKIAELAAAAADRRYHRMSIQDEEQMINYSDDTARIIYMSTSFTPREDALPGYPERRRFRPGTSSVYPDLARARWWDLKTVPLADSMLDWLADDRTMRGAQVVSSVSVRAQIVENCSTGASPCNIQVYFVRRKMDVGGKCCVMAEGRVYRVVREGTGALICALI